jgi:thiopurine S-methyltransferase
MEPKFWIERWERADIGFHQAIAHDFLERHWSALGVPQGAQVLVPLCGKSLDMVWLAERGHPVLGSELSAVAVDQFFAERSRTPATVAAGDFAVKRAGPYEIWCGDHFKLDPAVTRRIGGVFDRAALVAMPHVLQDAYAAQLAALTPSGVPVLLVALNYDPSEMEGPPFPIGPEQLETLFGRAFRIEILEVRDGLASSQNLKKRGLTALEETAIKLVRR